MNSLNSRRRMVLVLLAAMIALATPLAAGQRGPSKTKMPPLTDEQQAASKQKAKQSQKEDTLRTPFGEAKRSAKTEDAAPAASSSPFVEVEEKGDTIVFQRRTPFGPQTWEKKRSELTPQEEEMLRSHQAKQSADAAAGSAKNKAKPASPVKAASGEARTAAGQDREKR